MKRALMWTMAGVFFLTMGSISVQADHHEDSPEILAQIFHVKIQPGHALDFEKAVKKHQELHKAAGDPHSSHAFEVVAGKNVGSIYFRTGNLTWAMMDEMVEIPNDRQDVMESISPHMKSFSSMISEMMPKASNWPADYGVPKMVEVTMFTLDYEHMEDFFYGIHKIHQMIVEKDLPYTYSWNKVVVGGSGAQVYLSMPRKNWSEFKEPSPDLWQVAAEVMGKREAGELRAKIGAAIKSEESFVVAFRPDLSYMPE